MGIEPSVLFYDVGGSHVSAAVCNLDSNQLGRIISSPHPIDAAAVANDPSAAEVFKEFGCQLGRALRKTLTLFSPDVVVFGVAISIAADLFLTTAEYELRDLNIPLRVSALHDRAPLVGAGFAWPEHAFDS